jgi:hypothetical protein
MFSQQCQRLMLNCYMVASTLEKHSAIVFRGKQSVFSDYITMKMEELYSSRMLRTVYQLTQCHITESLNLLKFYVSKFKVCCSVGSKYWSLELFHKLNIISYSKK